MELIELNNRWRVGYVLLGTFGIISVVAVSWSSYATWHAFADGMMILITTYSLLAGLTGKLIVPTILAENIRKLVRKYNE